MRDDPRPASRCVAPPSPPRLQPAEQVQVQQVQAPLPVLLPVLLSVLLSVLLAVLLSVLLSVLERQQPVPVPVLQLPLRRRSAH